MKSLFIKRQNQHALFVLLSLLVLLFQIRAWLVLSIGLICNSVHKIISITYFNSASFWMDLACGTPTIVGFVCMLLIRDVRSSTLWHVTQRIFLVTIIVNIIWQTMHMSTIIVSGFKFPIIVLVINGLSLSWITSGYFVLPDLCRAATNKTSC